MAFGKPWVTGKVDAVEEERATPLHRLKGDAWIRRAQAEAAKGIGAIAVGFRSDEFTVGGTAPKVGTAGVEERASEDAERQDELAGIAALKRGPGKLQEKLLERLIRVRRFAGTRISGVGCQCAPSGSAKRLKTIELHIKRTLDSQIESRELRWQYRLVKRHKSDIGVSFCNRVMGCHRVKFRAESLDHPITKDRFFIALRRSRK